MDARRPALAAWPFFHVETDALIGDDYEANV